jgi:hypothetical protein
MTSFMPDIVNIISCLYFLVWVWISKSCSMILGEDRRMRRWKHSAQKSFNFFLDMVNIIRDFSCWHQLCSWSSSTQMWMFIILSLIISGSKLDRIMGDWLMMFPGMSWDDVVDETSMCFIMFIFAWLYDLFYPGWYDQLMQTFMTNLWSTYANIYDQLMTFFIPDDNYQLIPNFMICDVHDQTCRNKSRDLMCSILWWYLFGYWWNINKLSLIVSGSKLGGWDRPTWYYANVPRNLDLILCKHLWPTLWSTYANIHDQLYDQLMQTFMTNFMINLCKHLWPTLCLTLWYHFMFGIF